MKRSTTGTIPRKIPRTRKGGKGEEGSEGVKRAVERCRGCVNHVARVT